MKYTKIVATVNGGACAEELLASLVREGMDVARFNTAI